MDLRIPSKNTQMIQKDVGHQLQVESCASEISFPTGDEKMTCMADEPLPAVVALLGPEGIASWGVGAAGHLTMRG